MFHILDKSLLQGTILNRHSAKERMSHFLYICQYRCCCACFMIPWLIIKAALKFKRVYFIRLFLCPRAEMQFITITCDLSPPCCNETSGLCFAGGNREEIVIAVRKMGKHAVSRGCDIQGQSEDKRVHLLHL